MSAPILQPSCPESWQAYATAPDVAAIPLQAAKTVSESKKVVKQRNIFLWASEACLPGLISLTVFTDVLAFETAETPLNISNNGDVTIIARVLSAATPVTIKIPSNITATLSIYASILDQPITISTGTSTHLVNLGPLSGYAGVSMMINKGRLDVGYSRRLSNNSADMQASLNTQLRVATVQSWRNTSIAISLCSYVAKLTYGKAEPFSLMNTQAAALGQVLAGKALAGPNMTHAPVLKLARYKETTKDALEAAKAFQAEYARFQDKQIEAANLKAIWANMLEQAKNEAHVREGFRDTALSKYKSSRDTSESCAKQFSDDDDTLRIVRADFEAGVEKWKDAQKLKAAFAIFMAITKFAVSIGSIFIGNPTGAAGGAAAMGEAVKAVKAAETVVEEGTKFLTSDTLEKLSEAIGALFELFPEISNMVDLVETSQSDPTVEIPSLNKITGSAAGDANASAIVNVASWDKWVLQTDQQLEFAVENEIEKAADYRLELRKHAINGKQLAQAQAECIKAGYEYVQAQAEVMLAKEQIKGLETLLANFTGQEAVYAEAESRFYDRLMSSKTSVVIPLQNMVWAYRYWALRDSTVKPDINRSIEDFTRDIARISQELDIADSEYATGYQDFTYRIRSENLPVGFGDRLKAGLLGAEHVGSFTLQPESGLASDFTEGYHYRLNGLDPTLRGIKPKRSGAIVKLQITTSGIYADIQRGKIFWFSSLQQIKRCTYELDMDGKRGETRDDPISPDSEDHVEPTPFTQWKIKILNPEDLILDNLEGVDLRFVGSVRYDESRRRAPATD